MPLPSTVKIEVNGVDITGSVIADSARFSAQASGGVGTFSFTVRDRDQIHSFVTGQEVVLTLDNKRYFGGYLMQVESTFAFPVVDTSNVGAVTAREFKLTGVNYNALFDRLVVRNTSDYLHFIPDSYPPSTQAGFLVKRLVNNWLDVPSGITTTYVDDVGNVIPDEGEDFVWVRGGEQGVSWREEMEWVSLFNGAIYYIDAAKRLHYHAPESVFSRWGFSDRPNNLTVSSGATTFTGATFGFRELNVTEDLSNIINDIFVWGGSPFVASTDPGASGVLFARRTNEDSIDTYGRWQAAEVRFGELGIQAKVNALANAIVPPAGSDAPPGVGSDGVIRNRSKPEFSVSLAWFAHDVPTLSPAFTTKDHLTPGDIVTIILFVHGNGLTHPLILTLPLRSVSISFPSLVADPTGKQSFVRFDGEFGLSLSDPYNLWETILNRRRRIRQLAINSAGSTDTIGAPGGLWQGVPDETADGTRHIFTLSSASSPITYIADTSEVYVNGLLMRQGTDYSEDPNAGTIYIFIPPPTGSSVFVMVRLAG